MSPGPVIKASVRLCVLGTRVFARVVQKKGAYVCVCLWHRGLSVVCTVAHTHCEFVYCRNKGFVYVYVYICGVKNEEIR